MTPEQQREINSLQNKIEHKTKELREETNKTGAQPVVKTDPNSGEKKILLADMPEVNEKLTKMSDSLNELEDNYKSLVLKVSAEKKYGNEEEVAKMFVPKNASQEQKDIAFRTAKSILSDPVGKEYKEKFFTILRSTSTTDVQQKLSSLKEEILSKNISERDSFTVKALSTIVGEDGGYTCPPELDLTIYKNLYETSTMRQVSKVRMTMYNRIKFLLQREEPEATWQDQEVIMQEEESEAQKYEQGEISVHTLEAMPIASLNSLQDSMYDLEGELKQGLTNRFRRAEEKAFIEGRGNKRPTGIDFYAQKGGDNHDHYSEPLALETYTFTGNVVNADFLSELEGRQFAPYKPGSVYLLDRRSKTIIRQLKDSNGQYLFSRTFGFGNFPGLEKISDGRSGEILGYPVYECDDMPSLNASGAGTRYPVYFGNFSYYCIVDKMGMTMIIDDLTSKGHRKFFTTKRTGAGVVLGQGIKALKQIIT